MEKSNLVQTLAIWGAATGTIGTVTGVIGLILRYRAHKKDNPFLKCEADFSFEHSNGVASHKHKITVRSVGRRPVTLDHIRYFMKPRRLWHRIFRWYHWSRKRWVHDQMPRNPIHLPEGKKEDIHISLPTGFPLGEVLKVEVHDQAGNLWKVSWPRPRRLRRLIMNEKLGEIEDENGQQQCKVVGYLAGERFYVYAHWNQEPGNKNTFKGQFFGFQTRNEYERKWADIAEVQVPKFLREEIPGIQ